MTIEEFVAKHGFTGTPAGERMEADLREMLGQPKGTEVEVDTEIQWGVNLLTESGMIYVTRWDPRHVKYTEADARFDASRDDRDLPSSRKRLVTRTETTTVVTTPWKEVD